jgi:Polyketide cyclase / dehydrase and lipid transport
MDVSGYNHSDRIRINRLAADVYALVSDVTGVGSLSPVCKSAAWDDAAEAGQQGAWFTGHNVAGKFSWDTRCKVVVSDPGREFTFVNFGPNGDLELVRWSYAFEEEADGTTVTESWQVLPAYPEFLTASNKNFDVKARLEGAARSTPEEIKATLANLKRIAEA